MALNNRERQIVRELYKAQRPLSTNQVADRAEMSWNTADSYLEDLEEKGKVLRIEKGESGGKTVWILDVDRNR
jgi:predicted transcriptional regulator